MANVYVRSGAGGAATGADWANAYLTLAAAATAKAAGDDFWVSEDHAESTAGAVTITFPGTVTSPNRCICVNHAGSVPPVAADILATATVTTTGSGSITIAGFSYTNGVIFNAGTGATAANINVGNSGSSGQTFESCAFNLLTTAIGARISLGNTATIKWDNCTASFGSVSQGFSLTTGEFKWVNKPGSAAVSGVTIPTTLITSSTSTPANIWLDALDLSAFGSGKALVNANTAKITITNCKLGASVTVSSTPSGIVGRTTLIGSHSSGVVQRNEIYAYQGTLTTETTIIRTAGASDGTTAYSWKVVTTANSKRTFPFDTFEGLIWNDTTGSSKTLTVHIVTDNVTLTDGEIWVEAEYLGASGTPVSTLITDANATVLTTAANQTSDSGEAWTTTGLTTPVKQKLVVTFTPQMKGPVRWKVKVAKASTTVYIDPNADLT